MLDLILPSEECGATWTKDVSLIVYKGTSYISSGIFAPWNFLEPPSPFMEGDVLSSHRTMQSLIYMF